MKRVLIVGSGIAGLAVGEIFARNNHQVVVAERSSELGGASSRAVQNWFHTGNLYLHGLSGLSRLFFSTSRLFGRIYPAVAHANDVVNIGVDGSPVGSAHPGRWFNSDNPIYYCYARRGDSIPRLLRIAPVHRFWFKNIIVPRLLDSSQPFSFEGVPGDLKRALHGPGTDGARDDFYVLKSSDTTLYSSNILNTLVTLCGSKGGSFVTDADISLSPGMGRTNGGTAVTVNGSRERFDHVFLAAGAGNAELLQGLGHAHRVRNLYAPILVTKKKIFPRSFAIISPNPAGIFHHILYQPTPTGTECVSTISGCRNVSAPSARVEEEFKQACMRRFGLEMQDIAGVYWGCKTEQAHPVFRRNYVSALNEINENLYWVVPGKFSLFPYLVSLAVARFGLETPAIDFDGLSPHHSRIGLTMVQKLLSQSGLGEGAGHSSVDPAVDRHRGSPIWPAADSIAPSATP